jgi:hypothetical protein
MAKTPTALDTSLLPQYQKSAAMMERFLVAVHQSGASIDRPAPYKGIKLIDGRELDADVFDYFSKNAHGFRLEFEDELKGRLSADEFQRFCDVIVKKWFDGARPRGEVDCLRLKRSVYDYMCLITGRTDGFVQSDHVLAKVEPLLRPEAIAAILTVNYQMIVRHMHAWLSTHTNRDTFGSDDIFLRRGLGLDNELDTSTPYLEWDYLNSYSIAISAPEQFAQIRAGAKPAIVNGDIGLFRERVLFFSPFIPGMEVGQLEFGIIPSESGLPIAFQEEHGGFLEYILDQLPYHTPIDLNDQ